ncbi:MAG: TonB-dependent copper receptor [Magnetococcales bacterium]|nr:TonB-dependent copper receptor [Magnetococcales bacterium]
MRRHCKQKLLPLLLGGSGLLFSTLTAQAEQPVKTVELLDEVVVTAPMSDEPLTVRNNPKAPRQPIPAHDGSEYLKGVPGFSQIRKGGTDGDPVLRGMSGSRINILLDGQQIYGGCGNRMDPPTAYVFPETYDQVTVIKGPQSVINGAGSSAGAVLFERKDKSFGQNGWKGYGSLTIGSAGRSDQVGNVTAGSQEGHVEVGGTRTQANDYKDGSGQSVHSEYTRWSTHGAVGLTPNSDTLLELSAIRSDGKAAYADRSMDGSMFERENLALKLIRKNISPLVKKLDAQVYYNYVDHVMDNFTLRQSPEMRMANNPDRQTVGAHLKSTLAVAENANLVVGMDAKQDVHTLRSGSSMMSATAAESAMLAAPRMEDASFEQYGLFAEWNYLLSSGDMVISGARLDRHLAEDRRACLSRDTDGTCLQTAGNNSLGAVDRSLLPSGFVRYEGQLGGHGIWYAGVGHAERTADYWERMKFSPTTVDETTGTSAFITTDPEKTTQLDLGLNWKRDGWQGSVSGFYAKVEDYILLRWFPAPTLTRNIEATIMGGEADLAYRATDKVTLRSSLAYVRGENETDNKPLAQQPPLEFRLAADYDDQTFSAGLLWRLVAEQTRVDVGSGNIVFGGADIGESRGFGVLSVNAGYRTSKETKLTFGIDNLLDQTYAEHLSNDGSVGLGYPADTRIHEPGRTIWAKFTVNM